MTAAFRTALPSTQKFVFVALCDSANDQGECYPSIRLVAEKCSLGERTVQEAVAALEASGYVRREFRTGRSTVYWISVMPAPRPDQTHYVYRLDFEGGDYYIGVRTCIGYAEQDPYMGSGKAIAGRHPTTKHILSTHVTRLEAEARERAAVAEVISDPQCLNQRIPATGAAAAPRSSRTPQQPHPTPADCAPPPPQQPHPTPADCAPITIKEPSVEPSRKRKDTPQAAVVVTVTAEVLVEAGFDAATAADFIAHKAKAKAPLTPRAWADHLRESAKAGWTPLDAAEKVMARNWKGFDASYVEAKGQAPAARPAPKSFAERDAEAKAERVRQATGGLLNARPDNVFDMEAEDGSFLALR
jgi:hypothetical protein